MTIIKTIIFFGVSVILVGFVSNMIVGPIVHDSKYDTTDTDCDMRAILNKTDISRRNLVACNYYASTN